MCLVPPDSNEKGGERWSTKSNFATIHKMTVSLLFSKIKTTQSQLLLIVPEHVEMNGSKISESRRSVPVDVEILRTALGFEISLALRRGGQKIAFPHKKCLLANKNQNQRSKPIQRHQGSPDPNQKLRPLQESSLKTLPPSLLFLLQPEREARRRNRLPIF